MSPQIIFLVLFIILGASFSSCFSSYQEGPLTIDHLDDTHGSDHRRAYTTSIRNNIDHHHQDQDNDKHEPGFLDLIMMSAAKRFGMKRRLGRAQTPSTSPRLLSVDQFGAKGDGRDDTEAFLKAWKAACSSANSVLVVPKYRNYHLKPITFSGPCRSDMTLKVYGTIKASSHRSDYAKDTRHWLVFENIQNFVVEGGGSINGNGRKWWKNSCKINKNLPCTHAPTAVTFLGCNNLRMSNLRIQNAQQMHVSFQKCVNVKALNLFVTAPGNSPNTDGIHVTETQNINIQNCVIRTGDDCISIVAGSKNVRATDITCGPGHGISIGSLGADGSSDYVSNVVVDRARLSGTTNGVRIKTWQGGSGYAKNILFQNIEMNNVSNPIIIDQNYCDQDAPCREQASAVQISTVTYRNIKGTSASEDAVKFHCSESIPCEGISLQNVDLVRAGDADVKASCDNVGLANKGKVFPRC
ncbi:polygalacturonase QRT2 [Juglans microcarpa x Juglans regia]|uniref:polygalacturonase QRT2 n=1 Tax=Juglans microcarpa x Juglans regia TaxID=2249226 RepID=UPI001B7F5C7A|nr:polygalacturonase QRT2 [Juglans microcarpa x Juglans regia]